MNLPPIIGLSGVARSGKDTVGRILNEIYDYQVVSFSEALNDALYALNPIVLTWPMQRDYRWVLDNHGYEDAKEIPEVRRLLQHMGTEVGRKFFGQNVWVDALFARIPEGQRTAITNVRFPNEYDAVHAHHGQVWRVHRPGFEASNGHISDTALDNHTFDAVLENNTDVAGLAQHVNEQMEWILNG